MTPKNSKSVINSISIEWLKIYLHIGPGCFEINNDGVFSWIAELGPELIKKRKTIAKVTVSKNNWFVLCFLYYQFHLNMFNQIQTLF
jgi:hypothetical protein